MDEARELIRRARTTSGLTKKDFARRVGTSRSAIDEYESGRRSPSIDTLRRILGRVGLDLHLHVADGFPATYDSSEPMSDDLASIVDLIDVDDPAWTWRLLTADFLANVFAPATAERRSVLIQREPAPTGSARDDAFVAAVAEHAALCAEIGVPAWVNHDERRLGAPPVWFPVHGDLASTRSAAMAFSPASFRRRCIQIDGRDLPRIDR